MEVKAVDLSTSSFWTNKFEEMRETILASDEPLRSNYTRKSFRLEDQISTHVVVDVDAQNIISFSSAFSPLHWPNDIVRISNRTYVAPAYRAKGLARASTLQGLWSQRYIWPTLIPSLKDSGIKVVVVSRFNVGHRNAINTTLRMAQQFDPAFTTTEDYFLTYDNSDHMSCWQRLAILSITDNDPIKYLNSSIPTMSHAEFSAKFLLT